MKIFLKMIWFFYFIIMGFAQPCLSEIYNKSRAGLNYGLSFNPAVSVITGGSKIDLDHFHRIGINVEVPYNKYLNFGFGFDYTLLISPRLTDPRLAKDGEIKKISTTFLGLNGLVKPQYPFSFSFGDFSLYGALIGGLGASTPITFGTQALSDYRFHGASTFPTPFPLYLESTVSSGIEMFFSELVGVDVGVGYRILWVAHPFVSVPDPGTRAADGRSIIWYDVSSLFAHFSIKLAF